MFMNHLIPSHKGDDAALHRLQRLPHEQQLPLANALLGCLLDGNWPVYGPACGILRPLLTQLEQPMLAILQGDDSTWKRNVIGSLLGHVPAAVTPALRHELERIAARPSHGEIEEEVDMASRELLDGLS